MPPSLQNRRFSATEVCVGAGIDITTFKNWISRDPPAILMSQADRDARDGRGSFALSFARVMQVAITAQLVALGFPPRRAGVIAVSFSDIGTGSSGWEGISSPHVVRLPGELYPEGWTVLNARPNRDMGELVNVFPGKVWDPFYSPAGRSAAVVSINVTVLWWEVLQRLGLDRNGEPHQ